MAKQRHRKAISAGLLLCCRAGKVLVVPTGVSLPMWGDLRALQTCDSTRLSTVGSVWCRYRKGSGSGAVIPRPVIGPLLGTSRKTVELMGRLVASAIPQDGQSRPKPKRVPITSPFVSASDVDVRQCLLQFVDASVRDLRAAQVQRLELRQPFEIFQSGIRDLRSPPDVRLDLRQGAAPSGPASVTGDPRKSTAITGFLGLVSSNVTLPPSFRISAIACSSEIPSPANDPRPANTRTTAAARRLFTIQWIAMFPLLRGRLRRKSHSLWFLRPFRPQVLGQRSRPCRAGELSWNCPVFMPDGSCLPASIAF